MDQKRKKFLKRMAAPVLAVLMAAGGCLGAVTQVMAASSTKGAFESRDTDLTTAFHKTIVSEISGTASFSSSVTWHTGNTKPNSYFVSHMKDKKNLDMDGTDPGDWDGKSTWVKKGDTPTNISVKYPNAATGSDGNLLDIEITVTDWKIADSFIVSNIDGYDSGDNNPSGGDAAIGFSNKKPGQLYYAGFEYVKFRARFYEHGTTTEKKFTGFLSAFDLDSSQYIITQDGANDVVACTYIGGSDGNSWAKPGVHGDWSFGTENKKDIGEVHPNTPTYGAITYRLSTSSFNFIYGFGNEDLQGYVGYYAFTPISLYKFKPTVAKDVYNGTSWVQTDSKDADSVPKFEKGDTIKWQLRTGVPYGNGNAAKADSNLYSNEANSISWTDTIDNSLSFAETNGNVKIFVNGVDHTDWFKVNVEGQTLNVNTLKEKIESLYNTMINIQYDTVAKSDDEHDYQTNAETSDQKFAVIPNTGKLHYDFKDSDREDVDASSNTVYAKVPNLAEITVDKVVDKYEHKVGDKVVFTIQTKNISKVPARDIVVTDQIPSGFQVDSVTTSGVNATSSFSGQNVTAQVTGNLAGGATLTTVVTCTALESGNTTELYNVATAAGSNLKNADGKAQDDAEAYINSSVLSIDKTVDQYEFEVGDTANFKVVVTNTKGTAKNVVISDTLPEGLSIVEDSLKVTGVLSEYEELDAGTADVTNKLNPEYRNEKAKHSITSSSKVDGNGYTVNISAMPEGNAVTVTFSAKTTKAGNGKEIVNTASATADNNLAGKVEDDAELYINTADLKLTKKYVNPYQEQKKDNRVDNEFRVYEEETGNELVQYVVEITSSGDDGTVAKNVVTDDITLPDGLVLNFDDIQIVETSADGKSLPFTKDGGNGTTFQYHIAGTEDPVNQLDPDNYGETQDVTPEITIEKSGNGWNLKDTYLEKGAKLTVSYTAKALEAVNGMEIKNTATATADNLEKTDGKNKTLTADTTVYINSPRLVITKQADSEKYAVGDMITYSIDVTNSTVGTIARNLVIDDDIKTEGVKLQKASIVLMDADGYVIEKGEKDYTSQIKDNYFVLSTKHHLVREGNYSLWDIYGNKTPEEQQTWNPSYIGVTKDTKLHVEYQMLVTDKDLAGKEILNVTSAVSDEALKVETQATVTPTPPTILTEKEADKAVYGIGEDQTYTMTYTQIKEGTTATDLKISDQFTPEGYMEIKEDSFEVYFNGNDITKDVEIVLNDAKDGFEIDTKKDMENEDVIKVVYHAAATAKAAEQVVTNDEYGRAENAPEVHASTKVTIQDTPKLSIAKKSDKTLYTVGETGHYTVVVKQTEKNAVATNVVIEDAMKTEGTKISNIKLLDKEEKDITEQAEINPGEDSYQILTHQDLAKDETLTVTYDVLFESADLSGKSVKNIALTKADNAEEEKTDNTVELNAPKVEVKKSSDNETYSVGDTGHYTIKAMETEKDATALNVVITDTIDEESGAKVVKDSIKVMDPLDKDITKDVKITLNDDRLGFVIETGQSLDYKDSITVTYDVKFYQAGTVKNSAEATPSNGGGGKDDHKVTVIAPKLSIQKVSDKTEYSVGDYGHYTVVVMQTEKDAVAKQVKIKDAVDNHAATLQPDTVKITDSDGKDITKDVKITTSDDSYSIETGKDLAYNETFTVTYDVLYTNTSAGYGSVHNVAKASAKNLDTTTTGTTTITTTLSDEEGNALLTMEKTSDPETGTVVEAGQDIVYTIHVKNVSEKTLENVQILDAVPTGTAYKEGGSAREINGVTYVGTVIEKLEAGKTAEMTFTVTVEDTASGSIRNVGLVKIGTENADDPSTYASTNETVHPLDDTWVEDDNTVTVDAPVLAITKESDKKSYEMNETAHYTVVVSQTKENTTAKNVVIADEVQTAGAEMLPDSLKIKDPDGKDITAKVDIVKDETSYTITTGMDLAYGKTFTVIYDLVFKDASVAGKNVINVARAKADNSSVETSNDVTPVNLDDDITILKSAEPAGGTVVKAGDQIIYHITIKNAGLTDKKNFSVLDAIPENTTYVKDSGGNLVTIGEKQYAAFTVPFIASGKEAVVSFAVTVNKDVKESDVIKNVALVKHNNDEEPGDPKNWNPEEFTQTNEIDHPLNNWVTTDHEVAVEKPELTLEKKADSSTYNVGDTIHYTIIAAPKVDGTKVSNAIVEDKDLTSGVEIDYDSIQIDGKEATFKDAVDVTSATGTDDTSNSTEEANVTGDAQSNTVASDSSAAATETSTEQSAETTTENTSTDATEATTEKVSEVTTETISGTTEVTATENVTETSTAVTETTTETVSGATDSASGEPYVVKTSGGFMVVYPELSQKTEITFDAKITDESLKGKEISNTATVKSDQTEEIQADVVVKVPENVVDAVITKAANPGEKSSGTSTSGTSNSSGKKGVQTGIQSHYGLYAAIAALLCGAGVILVRQRRKKNREVMTDKF